MRKTTFATAAVAAIAIGLGSSGSNAPDWVLPNKKITPGATNPDVRQSNISKTICVPGWTATIRTYSSYTTKLKIKQLESDYANFAKVWGTETSSYEEDHLISLQLGGSPDNPNNLWPQPYSGNNAKKKDVVETALKRLVCSGQIKLRDAQKMIAKNWVEVYNKYATNADKTNPTDGD